MYGIIATWRMALEGCENAYQLLKAKGEASDAIELAIKNVEDFPFYKSVGYGGLPNEEMIVELDAAYMNGNTLDFGAIGAIRNVANPISVARSLSNYSVNNVLVGEGALKYAIKHGFEMKNMLTDRAKIHYKNRLKETKEIKPYNGHDTVGMVALDVNGLMTVGTSTSGLFMKKPGRIGDSPIIGSGFYVNSEIGGASATGLGEDLMKGCISYRVVELMKTHSPQESCDIALNELEELLSKKRKQVGDLSFIAMNYKGEFGAASNIDNFSIVVATENIKPTVYLVKRENKQCQLIPASQEWMDQYMRERMAPLYEK